MFKIEMRNNGMPEGKAAEFFSKLPPNLDMPAPIKLFTASPGFMEIQLNQIQFFAGHDHLSAPLLAAVRLLSAHAFDMPSCVVFNSGLLKAMGMSEEEIAAMVTDPSRAPMEDKERAMLAFVIKGLVEPGATSGDEVAELRGLGWSDADILDCVMLGSNMKGLGTALKILEA